MRLEARPFAIILKGLIIFVVINIAFAAANLPLGRLSIYNSLIPGRLRFPFENNVNESDDLLALFRTHVVSSAGRVPGEFRVFILGDSQTWGARLTPSQTLSEQLNLAQVSACGKNLHFYDLATPFPSVLKDFLVLHEGLQYKPDMVVWMMTAESLLPWDQALDPIKGNPGELLDALETYGLSGYKGMIGASPTFLDRTAVGQRRLLHGLALLQMSGAAWYAIGRDTASGLDTPYAPLRLTIRAKNLDWNGILPANLDPARLFLDVLPVTHQMIGNMPVLVAEEPIFIAPNANSEIRYNKLYPRWAFDRVLQLVRQSATSLGWHFDDLHDLVPYGEFTDDVHHLTPRGVTLLAQALAPEISAVACPATALAVGEPK